MTTFYPPLPDSLFRRVNTREEAIDYIDWLRAYGKRAKAQLEFALKDDSDGGLAQTLAREHNQRIEDLAREFAEIDRDGHGSEIEIIWIINAPMIGNLKTRGRFDRRANLGPQLTDVVWKFDHELSYVRSKLGDVTAT